MKGFRKSLLILAIALGCNIYSSTAQIYIKVRPARPHYERVVAPGPRHIWVDEEWEPRGGKYVFVGGRWMAPPRERAVWVPGHWRQTKRGDIWIAGHWR